MHNSCSGLDHECCSHGNTKLFDLCVNKVSSMPLIHLHRDLLIASRSTAQVSADVCLCAGAGGCEHRDRVRETAQVTEGICLCVCAGGCEHCDRVRETAVSQAALPGHLPLCRPLRLR